MVLHFRPYVTPRVIIVLSCDFPDILTSHTYVVSDPVLLVNRATTIGKSRSPSHPDPGR